MLKILFILFALVVYVNSLASFIKLENNRYQGVVVAINPEIPEDLNIIDGIKDIMKEASNVLWKATKNRAYFGEITILVPKTWTNGSYTPASNETYDDADVLIAAQNPKYGDEPYTVQYGQCGTAGEYIHITPDFILGDKVVANYGPKGKTMVHEWSHLRWGVFDESPTEGYDPFYYSSATQELQATRCPSSLRGRNVVIIEDENVTKECQIGAQTNWLPEDGCVFMVDKQQNPNLEVSIMSHQYIDQVITFCHDNASDPVNQHNHEAPNEHNRLCNQRSVWDVIMSSVDFSNDKNLPKNDAIATNVEPTFKVIQPQLPRFVLVLDTSGSMAYDNKSTNMITAASLFIEQFAPNGSAVGIVEFSSSASTLSNMVIINSKNDRGLLQSKLPTGTGGGTCIGCGIQTGIQVLLYFGEPAGGHILVLTDGEETTEPYVREVRNSVLAEKVVIDSMFFGQTTNDDLEQLTIDTNGQVTTSAVSDLQNLIQSFKSLSQTEDGDINEKLFQVHAETYSIPRNGNVSGNVVLDSTVGKQTVFTVTWSQYMYSPDVFVTDPQGTTYCLSSFTTACFTPGVTEQDDIKTIYFEIPGNAKTGIWSYNITAGTHSETVNVIVTTKAANSSVPPIVVESSMSATSVTTGTPVVVNAKVTKGYDPILGALVQAKITSTNTGSTTIIDLYDSGSDPDVRKDDGVYSRYFTGYGSSGRYSVQITVNGLGNESTLIDTSSVSSYGSPAALNYGYVDSNGVIVLNPDAFEQTDGNRPSGTSTRDIDAFTRIDSAGAFSYSGSTTSTDEFPPARVIDLTARQVDPLNVYEGVQLTFTAPGNDLDAGTADQYEIRYTYNTTISLSTSFTSGKEVTNSTLITGDLFNPSVANSVENFILNLTDIPTDNDLITVAFALRASDDAGHVAEISNTALMNLFLAPPRVSCTDVGGNSITGDPFEKLNDCQNFYQCCNGTLYELKCESGTIFNASIGVCNYPTSESSCSGETTDDDNNTSQFLTTGPSVPNTPSCMIYSVTSPPPSEFNTHDTTDTVEYTTVSSTLLEQEKTTTNTGHATLIAPKYAFIFVNIVILHLLHIIL